MKERSAKISGETTLKRIRSEYVDSLDVDFADDEEDDDEVKNTGLA